MPPTFGNNKTITRFLMRSVKTLNFKQSSSYCKFFGALPTNAVLFIKNSYVLYRLILNLFCSGFRTVTRELVTLAYFSVCLRRSFVTRVLERGEYMCGWPSDAAYNLYLYIKRIIFVPLKSTISNLAFPRPSFWQTSPQTESRWVLQRVSSG